MAKVIYENLKEDDPIFKEGLKISSHNFIPQSRMPKQTSQKDMAGRLTKKSTRYMPDDQGNQE